MTILATDIKLLESERMTDTTDGGGRRTLRQIPDGVAGNIFPKISRLDGVYGRVNLRKVYGAVQTANLDTYAGAHAVITDAPDNDRIGVTLFSTASEFDTRTAARDRIESYVTAGPESRMILFGRQLVGQQSIMAYQRVDAPLPEVGDVFALTTEVAGVITAQQYIRVQTVSHEVQTFSEMIGATLVDFQRRVVILGTGSPLRYEFNGPESPSQLTTVARPSRIRNTSAVDAARYFGIQPLAVAAEAGDLTARLGSIYAQLVPTTTRETAIPNAAPNSAGGFVATAAGERVDSLNSGATWTVGASRRTLRGIKPGTLTLSATGGSSSDNGQGAITGSAFTGTVDYETGLITRAGGSVSAAAWSAAYVPAVRAGQIAHTRDIYINLASRGVEHILTLNPLPAPGSVSITYRALDKFYTLQDDGVGGLVADSVAIGLGEIDYATGVARVTLGALPDIGSSLLWAWASPTHYVVRAGATSDIGVVEQAITLADVPVSPGTFSATYTSGGVDYTATDNGSGSISAGGVTGSINYSTGDVLLRYTTRLPDALSSVLIEYSKKTPTDPEDTLMQQASLPAGSTMALGVSITPGTLTGSLPFGGKSLLVRGTSGGLLIVPGGQVLGAVAGLESAIVSGDQIIGAINNATGEITVTGGLTISGQRYNPTMSYQRVVIGGWDQIQMTPTGSGTWEDRTASIALSSGTALFGFEAAGVASSTSTVNTSRSFTEAPLRLPVRTSVGDSIVPGSLLLAIGGASFIDRNGSLYANVSPDTGAGTLAGSINYSTGALTLSWWVNGAAPSLSVLACLSVYGEYAAAELFLRTAGAPLRPGSFYVQGTDTEGNLVTGQANTAGEISGTGTQGYIDQQTGIWRVRFGDVVSAAGNEGQWWYDEANVTGGQIWRPRSVIPSTIRYNAIALTSLPLNADLLGLDPVRLPSDGRVPIFRPSDVAVIHNTQPFTLPNPAVAGATYNVGRTDLAELWLEDADGKKLDAALFEVALEDGLVTMAAPLVLTGYVQPLVARHRIEDMVLVSDVQITGEIAFDPALTRDYPVDGSYVSSALLFGDMVARVTNVFDLLSWGAWSDTPGTGATAEYNTIDYPVEVLNNGAVTERWRINFTTTNTFQVIGENLGVIATGNTSEDCAPANALTGLPYFVIRSAGWGMGWSAGNQLRFNTVSASQPIWCARTILPGASLEGDSFSLQMRGDVDDE